MNTKNIKRALNGACLLSLLGCARHVFVAAFWLTKAPSESRFNFGDNLHVFVWWHLWEAAHYGIITMLIGLAWYWLKKEEKAFPSN